MQWRHLVHQIADLILPPSCAGCETPLQFDDDHWCSQCSRVILGAIENDYCTRCGLPVGPYLLQPEGCIDCEKKKLRHDRLVRVGRYDGPIGELVKKFKFQKCQRLDKPLGALLAAAIAGRLPTDDIDGLVPVPTTRSSRLAYGFSPVNLLTRAVERTLSIPLLPVIHVRGKKRRQTELTETQRLENVKNVFHLEQHVDLRGATLCVIDDVVTSGATMNEVARVLKRAGAHEVYAVTLAKAVPPALSTPLHTSPSEETMFPIPY